MHRHTPAAPQEEPPRPAGTTDIDVAVRNIRGYDLSAQAPASEDGEFLRRVMFDLVGFPPDGAHVKTFIAARWPFKRAAKVDELLASDDFADYWSRLFAEVYFGNYHDAPASARIVKDFLQWFKLKLQKDAPYTMTGKSRALVNRVWSWLLGRAIVHPVDDPRLAAPPISRGLLEVLAREFTVNNHSLKHLIRMICATDAYQRSCHAPAPYTRVDFSRATIKQLNGGQLVNALRVATGGKPGNDIPAVLQMVDGLFPLGAVWCETTPLPGNARQALLLRNSSEIMGWIGGSVLSAIKAGPGSIDEKIDEMFLAALSRKPQPSERARYAAFLAGRPRQGFEDAYWSLLNSAEFVTRH